jgi:hypothetical protein
MEIVPLVMNRERNFNDDRKDDNIFYSILTDRTQDSDNFPLVYCHVIELEKRKKLNNVKK